MRSVFTRAFSHHVALPDRVIRLPVQTPLALEIGHSTCPISPLSPSSDSSSPGAARTWATHALPLYGSASDGDRATRAARARRNREVMARFRRGGCGPLEVTADDIGTVSCPGAHPGRRGRPGEPG